MALYSDNFSDVNEILATTGIEETDTFISSWRACDTSEVCDIKPDREIIFKQENTALCQNDLQSMAGRETNLFDLISRSA
jgi:hypothetical protein